MERSEIECERINTKPHYQNKTRAAALNHVFMCINSAAWNKTARAERREKRKVGSEI